MRTCILTLCFLAIVAPVSAEDFSGDLPGVRQLLDRDASYSPSERTRAEGEYEKLRVSASDMTPAAFQLALAHIAALARNGHTMLLPGLWAHQFNRTRLHYYLFADGMFVIHTPADLRELAGARVLSIEGRSIDALRETFGQYFGARAGKRDEWIGFFLESPALLHAAGIARREDRLELELQLADGSRTTRTLHATLDPPPDSPYAFLETSRLVAHARENIEGSRAVPLYLAQPERAFRIEPLPACDAQFIQLRSNLSTRTENLEAFLTSALAAVKQAQPKTVILDLRFNSGGDLNITRAFMQTLPTLLPRDGRIIAAASGRTFSAGIASLGYLEQAGGDRISIAGEPVGDELEFWAEGSMVHLPVSHAALLYATERHNYVTGCPESDCHGPIREHAIRVSTLDPEIAAPLTYADYRAGRDPVLARACGASEESGS